MRPTLCLLAAWTAVVIAAAPWVAVPDYGAAGSELQQEILEAFRGRGIVIPFPQREVRVVSSSAYVAEARAAGRDAA